MSHSPLWRPGAGNGGNLSDAMKISMIILAVVALGTAAYFGFRPAKVRPAPVNPATLHEGTLATKTDPAEVFKRALWRRPAPDDKILHAERREWTEDSAHGVAHWQWFLAVEPGAALKKWLREQNPFSVHPVGNAAASMINGAPGWFPNDFSRYEVHTGGSRGSLIFLFSRDGKSLYATSSGDGFTPGVSEAARPAPAATAATGRLPLTPPTTSP
jgi:hypothetical protein